MEKENYYFVTKTGKYTAFCSIIIITIVLFYSAPAVYAQPERYSFKPEIRENNSQMELAFISEPVFLKETSFVNNAAKPDTTISQDTSSADENSPFPEEAKPKLLPDRMSFMEKFLWNENGFFRKTGIVAPLSPEERRSELGIRRTMLTAHMIGGFTTLGLMLAACYFGQQIIDGHNNYRGTHQTLVSATIGTYSLTGLLAVLSPPPMLRREEESTITIHKTLAWVHFAGMVITPILGNMIGGRRSFNIDKAHVHQISAYATTAVFAASMIVITF